MGPASSRALISSSGRRHRPITGTSGLLLFACMFLPAIRGCGAAPVIPLEVPPFLPPYLYGLAFAFVALARSRAGLVAGTLALRILGSLVAFAGFVVFLVAPGIGIVELTIGTVLLFAIGLQGASEVRLAATALVIGATSTVWFAMWSAADEALVGVYLALGSSLGLFLGGAVWLLEVWASPPTTMPRAILRYARPHEATARRSAVRARV